MKRNLFLMSSLFALTLGVVSCNSGDDMTQSNVNASSTHSSEVNLYLGNVEMTLTRGAEKDQNKWPFTPTLPTDAEKAGVLKYVQEHKGDSVAWPGYTSYFVQHVTAAHNLYSGKDMNNSDWSTYNDEHMDHLIIIEKDSAEVHVNDFNATGNVNQATNGSTLMTNGFKGAGFYDSYGTDNHNYYNWRLYYYDGNYYLAFDYETAKNEAGIKLNPDGCYDDWIVKIIPGKGETPKQPDTKGDPVTPDTVVTKVVEPEVEFDIHQQEHKDWNEIKTSIHVRDTACVRVFIPVPYEYQAVADDFDIRTGAEYTYIEYKEKIDAKFTFANKEYTFPVEIKHDLKGIEILIDCTSDNAKEALKLARSVYADGITFEIHSYVKPSATPEQVWSWVKQTYRPGTDTKQWPVDTSICTHVYGQVTSAYYPTEGEKYDERPVKTE